MKHLLRLCAVSLLFSIGFVFIEAVYACSGGEPLTVSDLVGNADIVVHGQLLEVDDAHQNAVLQVFSYMAGEPGPEHILLSLYPPAHINTQRERYSSGGCFYGVSPLQSGDEVVVFLNRKFDGSYELAPRHFTNADYYPFPTEDTTATIYLSSEPTVTETATTYETREVTLDEFSRLIQEAAGTEAAAPLETSQNLLFAPLLITTEPGTSYLLPVDGADPMQLTADEVQQLRRGQPACWSSECVAWSPNGINRAYLAADSTIELTYGTTITGDAFLFSSTSDALAVWNSEEGSTRLLVYMLFSYRIRQSQGNNTELINAVELNLDAIMPNVAAWSPDGRVLAFADAQGIWLWDALTPDARPELLTPTSKTISGFSPLGRYLIVGDGTSGQSIDLVSGEIYPAGAFSPDERILASYEPEFHIIQLTPYASLEKPPVGSHVYLAAWRDENTYLALTCPDEADRSSCRVVQQTVWVGSNNGIHTGYTFDYDASNDTLAIVKDEQTITIHTSVPFSVYDRDLSGMLDGDIASVEWLPSLFYEAHLN